MMSEPAVTNSAASNLARVIQLIDFSKDSGLERALTEAVLAGMCAAESSSFFGLLQDFLEISDKKLFKLNDFVRVIGLPFAHTYSDEQKIQKSLAISYGYVVAVSGTGLYGAEFYFVARSAVQLSEAINKFSGLSSLR